jgi:triacylglycerol lipase
MKKILWFLWLSIMPFGALSAEPHDNPEGTNIQLQYPLILVHGVVAHDRAGYDAFWGAIPAMAQEQGIPVYLGNTDAWGTYESNAQILKTTIERVLAETNAEKVNIIAHSKGGLDARYFIWRYDFGDRVASLTTISTPHLGTELADLAYGTPVTHTLPARMVLGRIGKNSGDHSPNFYLVLRQLTTEFMDIFNREVIPDERVYYQSFSCSMDSQWEEPLYFFSYLYVRSVSGANDGVVSRASTRWGPHQVAILSSLSHREVINWGGKLTAGISVPGLYASILRELGRQGF